MAIAVVGTPTTLGSNAAVTSVTVNVPSGVANGNFLLLVLAANNITVAPTPAGWTVWKTGTTTSHNQSIFYRVASSEPASYTVSGLTSAKWSAVMFAFSGVDTTTPKDVADPASVAGTTANAFPAITPVTAGAWPIGIASAHGTSGATFQYTGTNVTVTNAPTQTGINTGLGVGYTSSWTSGAFTPAMTRTSGASTRTLGSTIALRPSATGAAHTGALAVSGSGSAGFAGTPGHRGSLGTTGAGTVALSAAALTILAAFARDGSGALALSGSAALTGSLSVSGSGNLALAGVAGYRGSLGLSGDGSAGWSGRPGVVSALAAAGSGSAGFTAAAVAFTQSLARTGSGTLGLAGTLAVTGLLARDGSGALALAGRLGAIGALATTGAGALAITPRAMTVISALATSGSGQAQWVNPSANAFTGALALSGSGALGLLGNPAARGNAAFTGSGQAAFAGAPGFVGGLSRTGSGSLTLAGIPAVVNVLDLDGSGQLTVTPTLVTLTGSLDLTGEGTALFVPDAGILPRDITVEIIGPIGHPFVVRVENNPFRLHDVTGRTLTLTDAYGREFDVLVGNNPFTINGAEA